MTIFYDNAEEIDRNKREANGVLPEFLRHIIISDNGVVIDGHLTPLSTIQSWEFDDHSHPDDLVMNRGIAVLVKSSSFLLRLAGHADTVGVESFNLFEARGNYDASPRTAAVYNKDDFTRKHERFTQITRALDLMLASKR